MLTIHPSRFTRQRSVKVRGCKPAYLLFEALLAMALLGIIAIPWLGYMRGVQQQLDNRELKQYFQAKAAFIKAVHGWQPKAAQVLDSRTKLVVERKPFGEGLDQLFVNIQEGDRVVVSLTGVVQHE